MSTPISRTPHQRSSLPHKRDSSPELGDMWERTKYNSQTGRPVRKSAGKKVSDPNYVDTTQFVEDAEQEEDLSSSSDEEVLPPGKKMNASKRKKKNKSKHRMRKRKRSPSPPAPPMTVFHEELPDIEDSDDDDDVTLVDPDSPTQPVQASQGITLTFNVPSGFQGPFVVTLDRGFLDKAQQVLQAGPMSFAEPPLKKARAKGRNGKVIKTRESTSSELEPESDGRGNIGFLSLPPELRNKIYRLLLVSKKPFDFWEPDNFCRSGAFLRTCKQINEEGCGILYGENSFRFTRNRSMRGQYWDARTSEIGYKDMRRFLTGVGSNNLARMRDVTIIFEDSAPSSTPHLLTNEARRFVHDEQLLECLRIIGRNCLLKSMYMCFQGRRALDESFTLKKFLEVLCRIKADEVDVVKDPRSSWHQPAKVTHTVKTMLIREMTRKKKLYAVE